MFEYIRLALELQICYICCVYCEQQEVMYCFVATWPPRRNQKRQRNLTVANWVFAKTTHVDGLKSNFVW